MSSARNHIRRIIHSALLVVGLLLVLAAPASAHSALQSADPAPDSTTDQPAQSLTLVFAQPVDVLPDSVQVTGPDGQPLAVGESVRASDGVTVTADLAEPLPPGTSSVAWRVIGGDGHPIESVYTITSTSQPTADSAPTPAPTGTPEAAGTAPSAAESETPRPSAEPTPDQAAPESTESEEAVAPESTESEEAAAVVSPQAPDAGAGEPMAPEIIQVVGRWLAFAAILVAIGVIVFGVAVHPDSRADQQLLSRIVSASAVVVIVGTTMQLLGHVAVIAGEGMDGMTNFSAWGIVRGSGLMTASLLRVWGAGVILAGTRGFVRWSHDPAHVGPMLLGAASLLLSFQFTGHTATSTPSLLVRLSDAAHVGGAAVWTGGVVALAAVLAARRRRGDDSRLVVGRFSVAATAAVALVGVAGTALAVVELETIGQLFATGYGRILLAKLAIVGLVAAVGAFNHTRLVPAIVNGDDESAVRMQRTMRLELALFPLAIALTAVLVRMSP